MFLEQQWSKNFISFKGPLGFHKNVKNGFTALEKAEQNKKKLNLDLNKIKKENENIS